MKKKIPTDGVWIDYYKTNSEGSVYIIEINPNGTLGAYQYNGCACFQGEVTGFIAYEFQSNNQYFNINNWYKATKWGNNYPENIVFANDEETKIMDTWDIAIDPKEFDVQIDKINKKLDKYSIPAKSILEQIIQEVKINTGIDTWECDALNYNDAYGKKWFEAHIIIKKDNKDYLLTWMNCD